MVTCLKCGAEPMKESKRHINKPALDMFRCPVCGHEQKRYAGTEYETAEEKQQREAEESTG